MTTTVTFKGSITCKVFDEQVLKQLLDLGATDIQVTNGVPAEPTWNIRKPKKDGRRKPLSAEHRRKISEARKRLYAKRRATP